MEREEGAATTEVSVSTLDIPAIVASFDDDDALQESVKSASVLILPTNLVPIYQGSAFPLNTADILKHLRAGFGDKVTVEVAVKEKDFKEFDLRSDMLILPILYVSSHVLVPLAVTLLGAYIYEKVNGRSGTVRSEIHYVDPSGAQVTISYNGPSSTYEKTLANQLHELGIWLEGDGSPDDSE